MSIRADIRALQLRQTAAEGLLVALMARIATEHPALIRDVINDPAIAAASSMTELQKFSSRDLEEMQQRMNALLRVLRTALGDGPDQTWQ